MLGDGCQGPGFRLLTGFFALTIHRESVMSFNSSLPGRIGLVSMEDLAQEAVITGDRVSVICYEGDAPISTIEFSLDEWPLELSRQREFLKRLHEADLRQGLAHRPGLAGRLEDIVR